MMMLAGFRPNGAGDNSQGRLPPLETGPAMKYRPNGAALPRAASFR